MSKDETIVALFTSIGEFVAGFHDPVFIKMREKPDVLISGTRVFNRRGDYQYAECFSYAIVVPAMSFSNAKDIPTFDPDPLDEFKADLDKGVVHHINCVKFGCELGEISHWKNFRTLAAARLKGLSLCRQCFQTE